MPSAGFKPTVLLLLTRRSNQKSYAAAARVTIREFTKKGTTRENNDCYGCITLLKKSFIDIT